MAGMKVQLPTRRWLLQQFPPRLIVLYVLAAVFLTFASSLIPRPVYSFTPLETVRFGYPMPFLTQAVLETHTNAYPIFVIWYSSSTPVDLELVLAFVNIAFYLTAFALGRLLLRPNRTQ
jgi:hypothetical protein